MLGPRRLATDDEYKKFLAALRVEIGKRKEEIRALGLEMAKPIYGVDQDTVTLVAACLSIATCFAQKVYDDEGKARDFVMSVADVITRGAIERERAARRKKERQDRRG